MSRGVMSMILRLWSPCDLKFLPVLFLHLAGVSVERLFPAGRCVRIQASTRG